MKECPKCFKVFSTKTNLTRHLNTDCGTLKKHICEICKSAFTYKHNLTRHKITCTPVLEFVDTPISVSKQELTEMIGVAIDGVIDGVIGEVKGIRDDLLNVMKSSNKVIHDNRVVNTNINVVNYNLFLTQEHITQKIHRHFSDEHLCDGLRGIADFMVKYVLTNENGDPLYICLDYSRQLFTYWNENNEKIMDPKALKLIKMSVPRLKSKIEFIAKVIIDNKKRLKDTSKHRDLTDEEDKELNRMVYLVEKLPEVRLEVFEMLNNNKFSTELSHMTYRRN